MQNSSTYQIRLSSQALAGLRRKAIYSGFASQYRQRAPARGLGEYMEQVLKLNPKESDYEDTRPTYMQEAQFEELANGQFSQWDTGGPRVYHTIKYSPQARARAAELAKRLGIIRVEPFLAVTRALGEAALNSNFWEAIGLEYLKPVIEPVSALKDFRKTYTELEW